MQTCDVVITMLSNDEAVKEVYESENGLLSQDKTDYQYEYSFSWNSLWLKSVPPVKFISLMPVSGSVKPVSRRHLSYFSRQQRWRLYACQTFFNVLGKVSIPVGEPCKVSSAKFINYLLGLNLQDSWNHHVCRKKWDKEDMLLWRRFNRIN
jgi:3-hydroxyisobutyrate dehydrogenase